MFNIESDVFDANIAGYIKHKHADEFRSEVEEWQEGSPKSKINFSTPAKRVDFKKLYDFYHNLLVKLDLNIQNVNKNQVRRLSERYMQKRTDICIRIIDHSLVRITATQEVIDNEVVGFEEELFALDSEADASYNWSDDVALIRAEQRPAPSQIHNSPSSQSYGATQPNPFPTRLATVQPTTYMERGMGESSINLPNSKCDVHVYEADVSKLSVDSLLCPMSRDLDVTRGVAKAVANAAGDDFKSACQAYHYLEEEKAIVLPAGKMDCGQIIAFNPGYGRSRLVEAPIVRIAVTNALKMAKSERSKSVAMPLVGRANGLSVKDSSTAITRAVQDVCTSSFSFLNVHIVGRDDVIEARRVVKSLAKPRSHFWYKVLVVLIIFIVVVVIVVLALLAHYKKL